MLSRVQSLPVRAQGNIVVTRCVHTSSCNHIPTTFQVLDRVSQMCITAPAAVKKAFDRVDRSRTGQLDPSGVAELLRDLFKDLRPRDVHYLLQV